MSVLLAGAYRRYKGTTTTAAYRDRWWTPARRDTAKKHIPPRLCDAYAQLHNADNTFVLLEPPPMANKSILSTLSSICRKVLLTPSCDSTKHLMALRAWHKKKNVCLAGGNPTCSVPALYLGIRGSTAIRLRPCMTSYLGMRGSMAIRLRPCMTLSTYHPPL